MQAVEVSQLPQMVRLVPTKYRNSGIRLKVGNRRRKNSTRKSKSQVMVNSVIDETRDFSPH